MTIAFLFWLLMILWLVVGIWSVYPFAGDRRLMGGNLLLFILLFLIGWKVFGFPIQG